MAYLWNIIAYLSISMEYLGFPSGDFQDLHSLMVPWVRLNVCNIHYKRLIYTIPRHHLWYPDVASTRVNHNTNVECIPSTGISHSTPMSPQYWVKLYKSWSQTMPRHRSWCPDVVPMHVKRDANVECMLSLGINHGTLVSPQRVQNTMQTLMCCFFVTPAHQSWYPSVASMHVTHNTRIESIPSLGINHGTWCCLNACKTQYKHWIHTIPRHESWCPEVASTRVERHANVDVIQSLGITLL